MLTITIPKTEWYDEKTEEFSYTNAYTLQLEHSLISISKWEAKWKRPFFDEKPKSIEETIDYIRCMTINKVDPMAYRCLTNELIEKVNDYIKDPMTATWFTDRGPKSNKHSNEKITSELIYYWMIANQIPQEYQKWHINRLLTLIRICNIKNSPPKKVGKKKVMQENTRINEERRKKYNTSG